MEMQLLLWSNIRVPSRVKGFRDFFFQSQFPGKTFRDPGKYRGHYSYKIKLKSRGFYYETKVSMYLQDHLVQDRVEGLIAQSLVVGLSNDLTPTLISKYSVKIIYPDNVRFKSTNRL